VIKVVAGLWVPNDRQHQADFFRRAATCSIVARTFAIA
jgi:hypothetical protein